MSYLIVARLMQNKTAPCGIIPLGAKNVSERSQHTDSAGVLVLPVEQNIVLSCNDLFNKSTSRALLECLQSSQ